MKNTSFFVIIICINYVFNMNVWNFNLFFVFLEMLSVFSCFRQNKDNWFWNVPTGCRQTLNRRFYQWNAALREKKSSINNKDALKKKKSCRTKDIRADRRWLEERQKGRRMKRRNSNWVKGRRRMKEERKPKVTLCRSITLLLFCPPHQELPNFSLVTMCLFYLCTSLWCWIIFRSGLELP